MKTIKARDLWEKIGYAAWSSADPGLHFNTTMNDWHTCPAGGRIRASNPCSEYMFLDDTACNLASLNLLKFYERRSHRRRQLRARRASVDHRPRDLGDMAQFPSKEIAQLSYEYRTLGLGYANIGGLLMTMGLPYDSKMARTAGRVSCRDHDGPRLCDLGRDGEGAGTVRPVRREPACDDARHVQSSICGSAGMVFHGIVG
jgi:ribonucleoside-diphosphate reductase alpha chain